jgi:uncharacterized membrane protein
MEPNHPVQLIIPRQEKYSRLLALMTLLFMLPKLIILIPHLIIVAVLAWVSMILAFIAQLIVLFSGRYPEGLFEIVHGVMQWQIRVNAYLLGLSDKCPPFSMR